MLLRRPVAKERVELKASSALEAVWNADGLSKGQRARRGDESCARSRPVEREGVLLVAGLILFPKPSNGARPQQFQA